LHQKLWQVSIGSGEETALLETRLYSPAFSVDGKLVAYFVRDAQRHSYLEIVSVDDLKILHTFALNQENVDPFKIVWAPDGKSVHYIIAIGMQKSLWEQTLTDAKPRMIAGLGSDDIDDLAISPDGNSLAFTRGHWIHDAVLISGLK